MGREGRGTVSWRVRLRRALQGFRNGWRETALAVDDLQSRAWGDTAAEYAAVDRTKKKLILAFQAGRCGMKWLCRIFSAHANARGAGERHRLVESFYRYVVWNRLPIDTSGFLELCRREVLLDWEKVDISLLDSPYFSHDVANLDRVLRPDRMIWGINDPEFTVTSFYNKNWYAEDYSRADRDRASGYLPSVHGEWSHMFGRIVPRGALFDEWIGLTRVGKIAWFVNEVNRDIAAQIAAVPPGKVWIFRLEEADQNYAYYLKLAREFGLAPVLPEPAFLALKGLATKTGENTKRTWSPRERAEFEKYASEYIRLYAAIKARDP
jgi:hypothetical protein